MDILLINKSKMLDFRHHILNGQFLLTKNQMQIPKFWCVHKLNGWLLASHPTLPVIDIMSKNDNHIGFICGFPLSKNGGILKRAVKFEGYNTNIIDNQKEKIIEKSLYKFGGRWVGIILDSKIQRFYLDPSGSLAAVYSLEKQAVASTSSAFNKLENSMDWDYELIKEFRYYPFGFTPHRTIKRLLPNHYLDLSNWKPVRHWPNSFFLEKENKTIIQEIVEYISCNVNACINYGAFINLTAGRDTRMVLACSKEVIDKAKFFTSDNDKLDIYLAKEIANIFNLKHIVINTIKANEFQKEKRLYLSGYCVDLGSFGNFGRHKEKLDQNYLQVAGLAGEVGRAYFYKNQDVKYLDAEVLLKLMGMQFIDRVKREADRWLSEICNFDVFNILDLAYIEQRLGSWAGPNIYAFDNLTLPVIFAFNHREIFQNMLALPYEYKKNQQLVIDICKLKWPELLNFPFNEYTEIRRCINRGIKKVIKYSKAIKNIMKILF